MRLLPAKLFELLKRSKTSVVLAVSTMGGGCLRRAFNVVFKAEATLRSVMEPSRGECLSLFERVFEVVAGAYK